MLHYQDLSLQGYRALVTGASSGIGAGIAQALAKAGCAVAINYVSGEAQANALVQAIEADGGKAMAVYADVSSESDVDRMFMQVRDAFGGLDLLVNNAGLQQDAAVQDMTLAQWNKVIGVNLTGQFLCARAAVRQYRSQTEFAPGQRSRGNIICISSVHDRIPWAGHVNYAASKGGVMLMMQTLAQELAQYRIRVNSVSPGAIKTPINRAAWDTPAAEQELLKLIPYGRVGEPDDIARAVLWLASGHSDYVTGTTLYVDGGMTLYPEFRHGG